MRWVALLLVVAVVAAEPLSIWHITDLHLQEQYKVGSYIFDRCGAIPSHVLPPHPADFPPAFAAGYWGNGYCDSSVQLLESALQHMQSVTPNPTAIMWTGDNVLSMDEVLINDSIVYSAAQHCTDLVRKYFPNTPILPILGNHDCWPGKECSTDAQSGHYNTFAEMWKPFLTSEAYTSFKTRGGYYTQLVAGVTGLRVIGLNSNTMYAPDSGTRQMEYLAADLKAAKAAGERVIIIGHFSPSHDSWWNQKWLGTFLDTIHPYISIIVTHLWGHEHTDEIRNLNGSLPGFVTPSLTPYNSHPRNPSIRRILVDSQYKLVDAELHNLPLDAANEGGKGWQMLYSTKKAFDLPDLSGATVHQLVLSMDPHTKGENPRPLMSYAWLYNGASSWAPNQWWSNTNPVALVCTIEHQMKDAFDNCMAGKP